MNVYELCSLIKPGFDLQAIAKKTGAETYFDRINEDIDSARREAARIEDSKGRMPALLAEHKPGPEQILFVQCNNGKERKLIHRWAESLDEASTTAESLDEASTTAESLDEATASAESLESASTTSKKLLHMSVKTEHFSSIVIWHCKLCKGNYYGDEIRSNTDWTFEGNCYGVYYKCPECDESFHYAGDTPDDFIPREHGPNAVAIGYDLSSLKKGYKKKTKRPIVREYDTTLEQALADMPLRGLCQVEV